MLCNREVTFPPHRYAESTPLFLPHPSLHWLESHGRVTPVPRKHSGSVSTPPLLVESSCVRRDICSGSSSWTARPRLTVLPAQHKAQPGLDNSPPSTGLDILLRPPRTAARNTHHVLSSTTLHRQEIVFFSSAKVGIALPLHQLCTATHTCLSEEQ